MQNSHDLSIKRHAPRPAIPNISAILALALATKGPASHCGSHNPDSHIVEQLQSQLAEFYAILAALCVEKRAPAECQARRNSIGPPNHKRMELDLKR